MNSLFDPLGRNVLTPSLLVKSLKELEMEFETSDDKEAELKAIVQKAQSWRFPACPQGTTQLVLSANGFQPKWSSWQGPMCYWSDFCPYCGEGTDCKVVDPPNERCAERMRLRGQDMGPLCHVASLRWKLRKENETER